VKSADASKYRNKVSRFRHDPDMGPPKKLADTVTVVANPLLMASALRENAGAKQSLIDLESWMVRYQRADPEGAARLDCRVEPRFAAVFQEPDSDPRTGR
jgi:hypothetical protein